MVAKTITITEDSYRLLVDNKLENESFSEEIKRILSKKRTKKLEDFFGILAKELGADKMQEDLEKIKIINIF